MCATDASECDLPETPRHYSSCWGRISEQEAPTTGKEKTLSSQVKQALPQLPGAAGTVPSEQAAAAPQSTRLLFIDNLRILLICLVVVQHLAVTYGATGFWYYRDPAQDIFTSTYLTIQNGVGELHCGSDSHSTSGTCCVVGSDAQSEHASAFGHWWPGVLNFALRHAVV